MTTIDALQAGDSARIEGYTAQGQGYRRKLLAMGLTPGVEFMVVRRAPLGDPIEIRVRGVHLSLRREEAAALKLAKEDL
ncbi:FeoA family protein [Sulfuricystis thermophila]|uniref:FeoA family protein n=1 Tax=Sulfuricystis thermophila TaxID=2496847 RepID=UPI001036DAD7|nr:FeoA family protein [Sulfuricystis thermophila]